MKTFVRDRDSGNFASVSKAPKWQERLGADQDEEIKCAVSTKITPYYFRKWARLRASVATLKCSVELDCSFPYL